MALTALLVFDIQGQNIHNNPTFINQNNVTVDSAFAAVFAALGQQKWLGVELHTILVLAILILAMTVCLIGTLIYLLGDRVCKRCKRTGRCRSCRSRFGCHADDNDDDDGDNVVANSHSNKSGRAQGKRTRRLQLALPPSIDSAAGAALAGSQSPIAVEPAFSPAAVNASFDVSPLSSAASSAASSVEAPANSPSAFDDAKGEGSGARPGTPVVMLNGAPITPRTVLPPFVGHDDEETQASGADQKQAPPAPEEAPAIEGVLNLSPPTVVPGAAEQNEDGVMPVDEPLQLVCPDEPATIPVPPSPPVATPACTRTWLATLLYRIPILLRWVLVFGSLFGVCWTAWQLVFYPIHIEFDTTAYDLFVGGYNIYSWKQTIEQYMPLIAWVATFISLVLYPYLCPCLSVRRHM